MHRLGTLPHLPWWSSLLVIGIIALLISILLPSLSRARAQAATVACSSNLKQWYNAMLMYHNDYKSLPGPLIPATMSFEKAWNSSPGGNWSNGDNGSGFKLSRRAMSTANPDLLLIRYFKGGATVPGTDTGAPIPPTTNATYNGKVIPYKGVYVCPGNVEMYETAQCSPSTTYSGFNMGFAYRINNQDDTKEPYFFGYWGNNSTSAANKSYISPKKMTQIRLAGTSLTKKGAGTKSHSEIWMMSDLDGYNWSSGTPGASSTFFGIEDVNVPFAQKKWKPPHGTKSVPGRNFLFFDGSVRFYAFAFRTADNESEPYNGFNNTPQTR